MAKITKTLEFVLIKLNTLKAYFHVPKFIQSMNVRYSRAPPATVQVHTKVIPKHVRHGTALARQLVFELYLQLIIRECILNHQIAATQ